MDGLRPYCLAHMTLPTVRLARSGLALSRLGLGLSRLHYLPERSGEDLIRAAIDAGITHFDAARLYGDGLAERVLGRAIRGHRDHVTVATKFGLGGSRMFELLGPAAYPLRAARSLGRRARLLPGSRPRFTVAELEQSLRRSMAAIGTDRIDILFLHEPPPALAQTADDLFSALERARRAGAIRTIGVSAGAAALAAFAARFDIDVLQSPERDWQPTLVPDITFGALAGGPQRYGGEGVPADAVAPRLRSALGRRPGGAVLVSTTRQDHLAALAAIALESPA